jgi:UDPglucose 6-dehydrogenase
MKPDRVVVGTDDERAKLALHVLYNSFVRSSDRILHMSIRSAELVKYAANAMLATRISLMNEIANLCDALGADVDSVRKGVGTDSRIGSRFLFPGLGFGGSCFDKDLRALLHMKSPYHFGTVSVVKGTLDVNDWQPWRIFDRICKHFVSPELSGRRFCLWGLAFKPNTDDLREAPALKLARLLRGAHAASVTGYDPVVREVSGVDVKPNAYDAAAGCDAVILCTEWHEFYGANFTRLREVMRNPAPLILDGRNIWEPSEVRKHGFTYLGVGRR